MGYGARVVLFGKTKDDEVLKYDSMMTDDVGWATALHEAHNLVQKVCEDEGTIDTIFIETIRT